MPQRHDYDLGAFLGEVMVMKKIICFVFVSLFVFVSSVNVEASSLEASSKATVTFAPIPDDGYSDYIIYERSDGYYLLKFNASRVTVSSGSINMDYNSYRYKLNDGNWSNREQFSSTSFSYSKIHYNSIDLLNHSSGAVEYEKKLVPSPALPTIIKGMELGTVLTVVKEIAPIVVLSIVSFLGLRKAWGFCLSQLKSS